MTKKHIWDRLKELSNSPAERPTKRNSTRDERRKYSEIQRKRKLRAENRSTKDPLSIKFPFVGLDLGGACIVSRVTLSTFKYL